MRQESSNRLSQPIESEFIPSPEKEKAITLKKFLELLTAEENYYPGQQNNTKLMITRLRKVFYDKWGWGTEVIRGASKIPGRYEVKMVKHPNEKSIPKSHLNNKRNKKYQYEGLVPVVVYKKTDKEYPERAGQVPEIYANDNQEVVLPSKLYCDMGHILTGLDACNYPAPVTPLPNFLIWFYQIFPHVNSNMDFATWLGDIASTAGNFLFIELKNKKYKRSEEQKEINDYSPGSDMLGNIDSYIISRLFNINTTLGARVTQIFNNYFSDSSLSQYYRERKCTFFCAIMGLKNWDGTKFSNEENWIKYQIKQLRNATAFYVYGDLENFTGLLLALKIWLRGYEKKIDFHLLMSLFLNALKEEIKKEPKDLMD